LEVKRRYALLGVDYEELHQAIMQTYKRAFLKGLPKTKTKNAALHLPAKPLGRKQSKSIEMGAVLRGCNG